MFGGKQLRAPATHYARSGKRRSTALEAIAGGLLFGLGALVLSVLTGLFAGQTFRPGEQKVRPGTYVRVTSSGVVRGAGGAGVVAALVRSDWGPLATPTEVLGGVSLQQNFGEGGAGNTLALVERVLVAGPEKVLVVRQGTGGVKATVNLDDGAAVDVVSITAKYVGTRGNALRITTRDNLLDGTLRDFILSEDGVVLEQITYAPGGEEAASLAAAVNAQSQYVDAARLAAGDGSVADVAAAALVGGTQPTVNGAALTAALATLDSESYSVLVVDTVDSVSHTSVEAYVDARRNEGQRIMAVVGEPTSVAFATRVDDSKALNNKGVVYVLNGYSVGDEDVEGYEAAGRVAGAIAAGQLTDSLTNHAIEEATDVVGSLNHEQAVQAIQGGALSFTKNALGQTVIEYGITTLWNPGPEEDDGWKKIRRVRTRDFLVMDMVAAVDPLRGKVPNSENGRALVQARLGGVITRYIARGALLQGSVVVDPDNASAGDYAYFLIDADDLDSIEKLYMTFQYRFAPDAIAA